MATTTPDGGVRGPAGHPAHAKPGGGGHRGHQGHGSDPTAPMTHRQIMEALSGLLLGMFVAILSSTIVSNALPEIIADLHGSQSSYTWVVTAALPPTCTAASPRTPGWSPPPC
ncbi:MFS transporter, partial [Streptomyces sp. MCAF7]